MHFHPGTGAFDQGVGKFSGDVAGPVDVGFHVDAALRAANGRQHGRKVLRAILVVGHGVAFGDAGTQQRSDLAPELHAVHRADVLQPMLQLLLVRPQIDREDDDHPRNERTQCRPNDPPLRLCARHGHRSFFCRVFLECAHRSRNGSPGTRCAVRSVPARIDHIPSSPAAAPRLQSAGVDREVRGREHTSDHAPTWVTLKESKTPLESGPWPLFSLSQFVRRPCFSKLHSPAQTDCSWPSPTIPLKNVNAKSPRKRKWRKRTRRSVRSAKRPRTAMRRRLARTDGDPKLAPATRSSSRDDFASSSEPGPTPHRGVADPRTAVSSTGSAQCFLDHAVPVADFNSSTTRFSTRVRPPCLAAYIDLSACISRASAPAPSAGNVATPILASS